MLSACTRQSPLLSPSWRMLSSLPYPSAKKASITFLTSGVSNAPRSERSTARRFSRMTDFPYSPKSCLSAS